MTDTLHLEIITAGGAVVDTPAAQMSDTPKGDRRR